MALSSLLTLFDDIATVLDDVATMSQLAAKKTSGVLGDDLALNAEQVSGIRAERELPVVWAVARGSLLNKAVLVPAALAISLFIPWAIIPLLMLGGGFLCFEGFEKLAHTFFHRAEDTEASHASELQAIADPQIDLVAFEKEKIKGAVRTDFVLSGEIIVITLGTVAGAPAATQFTVLAIVAVVMTLGVYGLVGAIVKLDDLGLYLSRRAGLGQVLGGLLLRAAPLLMKALSLLGTVAMFMVGGGILMHGVPGWHHVSETLFHALPSIPGVGSLLSALAPMLLDALMGVLAGAVIMSLVAGAGKLYKAVS
jgi:predicted DNA repair protein MutK